MSPHLFRSGSPENGRHLKILDPLSPIQDAFHALSSAALRASLSSRSPRKVYENRDYRWVCRLPRPRDDIQPKTQMSQRRGWSRLPATCSTMMSSYKGGISMKLTAPDKSSVNCYILHFQVSPSRTDYLQ